MSNECNARFIKFGNAAKKYAHDVVAQRNDGLAARDDAAQRNDGSTAHDDVAQRNDVPTTWNDDAAAWNDGLTVGWLPRWLPTFVRLRW